MEEDGGPDGRKESLRKARPGAARLFAAGTAGWKAGEANAMTKGLSVHPEEKIRTCREESKWCAGVHSLCLGPHYRHRARARGTLSTLGLPRAGTRLLGHTAQ